MAIDLSKFASAAILRAPDGIKITKAGMVAVMRPPFRIEMTKLGAVVVMRRNTASGRRRAMFVS